MMRFKKRLVLIAWAVAFLAASGFFVGLTRAGAGDQEAAIEILDRWTSIRWGVDSLAWVVHYPDELVEPWVRAEAQKRRMGPDQAEAFRQSFVDELRIGSATAVMLSVQSYAKTPINLSPLSNNIALIDSSGRRVSPIVVEKKLDSPLTGLVQGFVFFPKQDEGNFSIALKGLIPNHETIFSFGGVGINTIQSASAPPQPEEQKNEVVVKIPTTKKEQPKNATRKEDEPEFSTDAQVYPPTAPRTPEPPAREEMPVISTADLPPPEKAAEPAPIRQIEPAQQHLGSRQVIDIFLRAWVAGDVERMYSLLSAESKEKISRDLFERDVMSGGFRNGLKSGYKINWVGDSARVTVAKKVIFMRTMETKQINFAEENGSARVIW
ncbi:MAG: hypothetical protein LBT08_00175 [Synergistaceae bacterium]|nr:hypothetical protein [Synergistaceae bacterium]